MPWAWLLIYLTAWLVVTAWLAVDAVLVSLGLTPISYYGSRYPVFGWIMCVFQLVFFVALRLHLWLFPWNQQP